MDNSETERSAAALAAEHFYVHVPFCDVKCTFCALYSTVAEAEVADRYVAAALAECDGLLGRGGGRAAPVTLYFGGGTPTQLTEEQLARLCEGLAARLDLSALREWTVECSPSSVTPEKLRIMRDAGVNRLSFGVQTFDDERLRRLRRLHTGADVGRCFEMLRALGFSNAGVDLIACLPGVDAACWREDLGRALALAPEHISVYGLGVEEGSPLGKDVAAGRWEPATEETHLGRLALAETLLGDAGYGRYEISNYARPGFACEHNLAYWLGRDFVGIGPAAGSRLGAWRRRNASDLRGYLERARLGEGPPGECERLSVEDDISERYMFAIRTDRGVALPAAAGSVEAGLFAQWTAELEGLRGEGIVREAGGRWWLTARGRAVADSVSAVFLA